MTNKDLYIVETLKDICLELQDKGITVRMDNHITRYGSSKWSPPCSFFNINIFKKEMFNGSDVSDVFERLYFFMKENRFTLWVDIHLYNDNHYNNGLLDFNYRYLTDKRLEEFFDIIRFNLENGVKSIEFNFKG